jgi:hypothetical protein
VVVDDLDVLYREQRLRRHGSLPQKRNGEPRPAVLCSSDEEL